MAINNLTEANTSLAGLKTTANGAVIISSTINNLSDNLNLYLNDPNTQKLEKLQTAVSDFLYGIGLNGGLAIPQNTYSNELLTIINGLVSDINLMISDATNVGNTAKATYLTNALITIEPIINSNLGVLNVQMTYVKNLLSASLLSLDAVVFDLSGLMLDVAEVSTIANDESVVSKISNYPDGLSTIADSVKNTNSAEEAAFTLVNAVAGPVIDLSFSYVDRAVTETGNAKDRFDVESANAIQALETQINALQAAITTAGTM